MSLHSLAECYAVLTRIPGASRVSSAVAWQLIHENAIKSFTMVALTPKDHSSFWKRVLPAE